MTVNCKPSSTEAQYMSLVHVTKLLLWIVNMIENIPEQFVWKSIPIYVVNKPSINLSNSYTTSKFTRQIGINHHFLRYYCYDGTNQFELIWTSTKTQAADGMTKPLARTPSITFRYSVVSDHESWIFTQVFFFFILFLFYFFRLSVAVKLTLFVLLVSFAKSWSYVTDMLP